MNKVNVQTPTPVAPDKGDVTEKQPVGAKPDESLRMTKAEFDALHSKDLADCRAEIEKLQSENAYLAKSYRAAEEEIARLEKIVEAQAGNPKLTKDDAKMFRLVAPKGQTSIAFGRGDGTSIQYDTDMKDGSVMVQHRDVGHLVANGYTYA